MQEYAEKNGLEIVDRFDDIGVSAYQGKNSEFGALSEFTRLVDAGEIPSGSYLIVESMDRLTRQTVPRAMSLLLGLTSRGILVAILDENRVYSDESNSEETYALMTALVSMSRAHEESRRKSSLISAAWENKRMLARTVGKITTSKVPGWLKNDGGKIVEIERRVEIVKEIFDLTINGYGAYSIARRLNERGEPPWSTRKNAVWRESYVKKIIQSRTVLGEYQPHRVIKVNGKTARVPDGEPLVGYYPQIVSNSQFQDALASASSRSTSGRGRKGARYVNLFTGLLRCRCGAGMRYIDKGPPPKGGAYLQCSVAFIKGACTQGRIKYEVMEEVLLITLDRLDIGAITGSGKSRENLKVLRAERADLNDEHERAEREAQNLVRAIKSADSASNILAMELVAVEGRLHQIRSRIHDIDSQIETITQINPEERRRNIDELLVRLRATAASDYVETRRSLAGEIQRLLRKIVVRGNALVPWEIMDSDPDWKATYGVSSPAELERLCRERNFEATLVYRGGESLVVDSMYGEIFRAKKSVKMKSIEHLSSRD